MAKISNGFEMARCGRFDVEYSAADDRLIVYVHRDDDVVSRVYIESDCDPYWEVTSGSTYDNRPIEDDPRQTAEIELTV